MAEQRQARRIPNLLSLRGARSGRGHGRGSSSSTPSTGSSTASKDKIVQQTDQDASGSRMSAVALDYLQDPFAQSFVQGEIPKRYPIINRGTYIRTTAIDRLVYQFLATCPDQLKQIISLGAGSDTRYFRLISKDPSLRLAYHELDFPENTATKIAVINKSPKLLQSIENHLHAQCNKKLQKSTDGRSMYSAVYNVHPIDLRTLVASEDSFILPAIPNVSASAPTLLLSECCLIYLPPNVADGLLKTLTTQVIEPTTPLGIILYEPIRPNDAFGQVMISNLAQRGIVLQTLRKYASLSAQKARLRLHGFVHGQQAADVHFIFDHWTTEVEKERISRCEMLDELEEWIMLAQHYCIAWGWRDRDAGGDVFSKAWGNTPTQADDDGIGGVG